MAGKIDPERRDDRKQEILTAARRCFLRNGMRGTSIALICKEAKISPGHLYYYFRSKDEIIEQMGEGYLADLHSHIAKAPQGTDLATTLLSELWAKKDWDDLTDSRFLFELLAEAGRNEAVQKILVKDTESIRFLIIQILREAQADGRADAALDVENASLVLVAVLNIATMLPLMAPGSDFDRMRGIITDMVRGYVKNG
ncbi:TetR/AcrR family transcriptional regulator [Paracoccus caeni]|uniref:TetR/AcrR family transcriptional regulator n=1 Tax=Paracoccus caeni TaxID=657651 RepID=A0A934VY38_9RHOB|nr:TetR/AcrR family transcriptional regulator [Paracoccus caeni]MBK4215597.1 TetR/AcrR family transcriptional regulator [Paracoccus caeni]